MQTNSLWKHLKEGQRKFQDDRFKEFTVILSHGKSIIMRNRSPPAQAVVQLEISIIEDSGLGGQNDDSAVLDRPGWLAREIPNLVKRAQHNSAMTADRVKQKFHVPGHELDVGIRGSQHNSSLKNKSVDDLQYGQGFGGSSFSLQDEHQQMEHLHPQMEGQPARVHPLY